MPFSIEFVEDIQKDVDDLKYALAGYIKGILGQPDLSERIIENTLTETDLFSVKSFCNSFPVFRGKEFLIKSQD